MTAQLFDSAPEAPAGAVRAAREVVGDLQHVLWAAKSPAELLEVTAELEQLRSTLAAIEALTVVEIDQTEAAKTEQGWASTKDYVTATSGGRRGHGPRLVKTATALAGSRRATWSALHDGGISPEHADVIVRVIDLLPVDAGVRDEAERFLIDQAAHLNATDLQAAGDHLLEVLDPGRRRQARGAPPRQARAVRPPESLPVDHRRRAGRGEAARSRHGRGRRGHPSCARVPLCARRQGPGAHRPRGRGRGPRPARPRRPHLGRPGGGLPAAAGRGSAPTAHGAKPRVMVFIDYEQLRSGHRHGHPRQRGSDLRSGGQEAGLRRPCHPRVLGTHRQVLDVGRSARLVTMGIWLALVARDRHCAFPGCRRPPIACDAHHVTHWIDGGSTSLGGMVLLCRAHHTIIHTTDWQVRINPADQKPEFKPPAFGRRLRPRYEKQLAASGGWIREMPPRE